jgi:hypothetical protein
VLTPEFVYRGVTAFDIPAVAAVVWAAALELRKPRRGGWVWVLLAMAGLIRPDFWLIAGVYWLYLAPSLDWPGRLRAAAWAASAPLIWVVSDTIVTGKPLWSLTHTQNEAELLGRTTGLSNVPDALFDGLRGTLFAPMLAAGLIGMVIALALPSMRRRALIPATIAGLGVAFFFVIGVAELSLLNRYLLPAAAMLVVFAAVATVGWTAVEGRERKVWMIGGTAVLLALAATLPRREDDMESFRASGAERYAIEEDMVELRHHLRRCTPVHVHTEHGGTGSRAAFFGQVHRKDVQLFTAPPPTGVYLVPASQDVANKVEATDETAAPVPSPPASAELLGENRSWQVYQVGC